MQSHKLVLRPFVVTAVILTIFSAQHRASAQPEVQGQWSALQTWPIVAVHSTLQPDGKVFFYPYGDDPRVWDPATNAISLATKVGYNIFCAGHTTMADGRILVAGGHVVNGQGLNDASIFDPAANTWTRLPDMNNGRWYPSVLALGSGNHLVLTGSYDANYTNNQLPQVFETSTSTWRDLTGAVRSLDLYPGMHVAPNGRAFITIPSTTTRYLDTAGTGAWSTVATRVGPYRGYGSSVMYDHGKVLVMGGADPPVPTAEVIDLNAATPAWRAVGSMSIGRRQINATIMADGKVLVTGGSSAAGFNEPLGAVLYAESWDPGTEQWTQLASYTRYRGYHSTALLLPDGRVLSAGGDGQPNAEVFSPPYLFKGLRPTITFAPGGLAYGQTFQITTPDTDSIGAVHLIRLGSVTHAINMDQRICRLPFSIVDGGISATTPASSNACPPGYYMLFMINKSGVPSVAKTLRVGIVVTNPPASPTDLVASALTSRSIALTWTSNSIDEAGFEIERKRIRRWERVTVVGPGVTAYTETGLRKNTTYTYRVRAFNSAGPSAYSNQASATTLNP